MKSEQFYIEGKDASLCALLTKPKNEVYVEECVIFLHGLTSTKSEKEFMFTKAARHLVKHNNCISIQFDFSGHGDSTGKLEHLTLHMMVSQACEVIKFVENEMGVKKIHLVGTGIGNFVGLKVCQINDLPIKVTTLKMIEPAPNFSNLSKSFLEDVDCFNIDDYLGCIYEQTDGIFGHFRVFTNQLLHSSIVDLGAINYENIVEKIGSDLIDEIKSLSLVNEIFSVRDPIPIHIINNQSKSLLEEKLPYNVNFISVNDSKKFLYESPKGQLEILEVLSESYRKEIG